jgi:hypothetical protein
MRAAVFALALMTAGPAAAQPPGAEQERDKAAIVQTALDYAEGYYGGEPARMTRALSPYLSKRGLTVLPDGTSFLVQMNADTLIDASNGAKLAAAERHITTEVLEITGDIASARVFTARFNDYLHLVKRNGAWQILNVLWHQPPPATAAPAATSAVEQAVKDYSAALYSADSRRATQLIHPVANLRTFAQPPNRSRVVVEQNPETLAAALAAGRMKYPGAPGDVKVVVQGVDADIAAAKLTMGPITTYLHLALQHGQWRVVNTLSYPPAAAGPSGR